MDDSSVIIIIIIIIIIITTTLNCLLAKKIIIIIITTTYKAPFIEADVAHVCRMSLCCLLLKTDHDQLVIAGAAFLISKTFPIL